ncbi:MAG: 50S ribosomal protein L11 methyltransferase [Bacteriovoracaceae bacterium]|nr:50S ribosomal protein L11 methyltransferase [Bacteriovoracaceae bacterium]
MSKNYVILTIYADDKANLDEFFTTCHEDYSCLGVEDYALEEAEVDSILGEKAFSGGDVTIEVLDEVETKLPGSSSKKFRLFFNELSKELKSSLESMQKNNLLTEFTVEHKTEEDWNKTWRGFYSPINVSDKIKIIPEWIEEEGNSSVKIYPGMGFGTGTHETTFLCLCLFDEVYQKVEKNENCLDFGCGSGILGIAAIKYADMSCDFVDIDKPALDNCLYNLQLNFKDKSLEGSSLIHRDNYRSENQKYRLVFANILENVLILEKEVILNTLEKGSFLIVSGLLRDQVDNIKDKYSCLKTEKVIYKNDWAAILFVKED